MRLGKSDPFLRTQAPLKRLKRFIQGDLLILLLSEAG